MKYLKTIAGAKIEGLFSKRAGETRLGETCVFIQSDLENELKNSTFHFVVLGIPEDIGVRANFGKPGTASCWENFLPTLLSIQSNSFLNGDEIAIAGEIECDDLNERAKSISSVEELSTIVNELDDRVFEIIEKIVAAGKIPIVIGGGHNNAYPIIKACVSAIKKNLSIINVDPHADLREADRRHSGNGFSYAMKEDLMELYLQIGLHENYNNEYIVDTYKNLEGLLKYFSYDDYLRGNWSMQDLDRYIADHIQSPCGLELDADCIENMPSSAQTPSGFSVAEIRKLVISITEKTNPVYFHIPETIPTPQSSKLLTYLVTDFIKSRKNNM